jgi:hypothetical protein
MTAQIMTANKLSDGIVVFLAYDGTWTRYIDDARVAEREEDFADMEAEAAQSIEVVDPYLIDVEVSATEGIGRFIRPTKYRERIRAFGPSTHPAFAKKLVPDHFRSRTDASSIFMNGI